MSGTVDGPFTCAFMAVGDGTHQLPIKAELRADIGQAEATPSLFTSPKGSNGIEETAH